MTPQGARPEVPALGDLLKLLAQFDRAWQAGAAPRIEDFLARAGNSAASSELLEELIKVDLEYRWRQTAGAGAAERPRLEEYLRRFPELGPLEQLPAQLIAEEYRVRQRWGDCPGHAEYATRFPRQAALTETLARVDADLAGERQPADNSGPPLGAVPLAEPSPEAVTSGAALIDAIRQDALLTLAQVGELLSWQGRFPDAHALGRELLGRGWLTAYQLNQLLLGRGPELLLGPYVLMERLGEGGAGQVFKARHQKMNRIVALKLIRKELLTDAEVVARFYREIQVLSRLDHPNVVHAFDAGPAGPSHFLAMEFVEGTDLGKLVKQSGPLAVMQACAYIHQAALGLQHAHERGLVHRDIKPHNLIMSVRDGLIKVADLGLARLPRAMNEEATAVLTGVARTTGTLTPQNAAMIGTLDYLAPEQALDFHKADIRSDIYALGCTFYYLLTGQSPVAGGTLAEKLLRHQQAEPPPVEQFRKDIPVALPGALSKMLAKRPEDRYQTPAEVAAALAPLLEIAGSASDPAIAAPWASSMPVHTAGLPSESVTPSGSSAPTRVLHAGALPSNLSGRSGLAARKRRLVFTAIGVVLLLGGIGLTLLWRGPRGIPSGRSSSSEKAAKAAAGHFVRQLEDGALTTDQVPKELSALREKYSGMEEHLRTELLAARASCAGKPQALLVGEALMQLPSALDRLPQRKNEWLAVLDQEGPELSIERIQQLGVNPFGLDFSPDCKTLAVTGTNHTVRLWNLEGAKLQKGRLLTGHTDWVHAVAFSPDGRMLATGSRDKTVRLWDPANGKELAPPLFKGGYAQVLAFTSDGKTLASGGDGDVHVRLWDLTREKPQPVQVGGRSVLTIAPDRGTIAVADSYQIDFLDLTKSPPAKLPGIGLGADPRTDASSLAYRPDGKLLAVGYPGGLGIWDMPLKGTKKLLGGPEIKSDRGPPWAAPTRAAFTPNGKTVVAAYFIGLQIATGPDAKGNWSTRTIELPPGLDVMHSFALASDGRHVALGDNKRKVYILRLAPPPVIATNRTAPVLLSDLPETEVRVGWDSFGKHGSLHGTTNRIIVNGVLSPNGLSMHPPSNGSAHVSYWLGKKYQTLKAVAALNDGSTASTAVIFKVRGDGKDLWQSKPLKQGSSPEFTVSVTGVDKLELEVHCPGDDRFAHAVWVEPQLLP